MLLSDRVCCYNNSVINFNISTLNSVAFLFYSTSQFYSLSLRLVLCFVLEFSALVCIVDSCGVDVHHSCGLN